LRRCGLISSQNSATRSRTGYYKHDDGTSRSRGYDNHKLSTMRPQRDTKTSAATTNIETSSLESGEMPIMRPSHKASIQNFESADPTSVNNENGVYFRTAIKGGDRGMSETGRSSSSGRGTGIQMETTVSVRTEPNLQRREADIV
jgi:hypothetical protein